MHKLLARLKHNVRFIVKSNTFLGEIFMSKVCVNFFCYFFGMFTGFLPHVFLIPKKQFTTESYKCKFKLVELASEQAREKVNAPCLNV